MSWRSQIFHHRGQSRLAFFPVLSSINLEKKLANLGFAPNSRQTRVKLTPK